MFWYTRGAPCHQKAYELMQFGLFAEDLEVGRLPEHILPRDVDIPSEYGIGRSGRHVYMTHGTNQDISDSDLKR